MLEQVLELFAETASITGQIVDAHPNDWQWLPLPKMGKRYQIAGNGFRNGNQSIDAIKNIAKRIIASAKKREPTKYRLPPAGLREAPQNPIML